MEKVYNVNGSVVSHQRIQFVVEYWKNTPEQSLLLCSTDYRNFLLIVLQKADGFDKRFIVPQLMQPAH